MAKKHQLTTSDHLPYEEFQRFLDNLHKDGLFQWEMYARLSFCTACRCSDVSSMHWGDVLGQSRVFVVEKKTSKPREIPLNPSVQQKFQELWNLCGRPDKSNYILQSHFGDHPVTIQYINRKLKEFKERYKMDIRHFSTHTFRKTFGRHVYETNGRSAESLLLLNKILNHSTVEITKTYIGITQDEVNGVYNSICF